MTICHKQITRRTGELADTPLYLRHVSDSLIRQKDGISVRRIAYLVDFDATNEQEPTPRGIYGLEVTCHL